MAQNLNNTDGLLKDKYSQAPMAEQGGWMDKLKAVGDHAHALHSHLNSGLDQPNHGAPIMASLPNDEESGETLPDKEVGPGENHGFKKLQNKKQKHGREKPAKGKK